MNKYLVIVKADDAQKIVSDRLTKLRKTKYPHYSFWILMCIFIFVMIEVLLKIGFC